MGWLRVGSGSVAAAGAITGSAVTSVVEEPGTLVPVVSAVTI